MIKHLVRGAAVIAVSLFASAAIATDGGEAVFKAKCSPCHLKGGNIVNPNATLKGIKDPKTIISKLREGGGGMPAFNTKSVSEADAKMVADYIVKTFTK